MESELFGHERGAFTSAISARPGVFEQADGGTLFLDEIGELPLSLQPKLLRALENRVVRRVGGQKTIPVDVRVLAATNRDLLTEVAAGSFRQDIYYRIATFVVLVPPLRDRLDDIALLLRHFQELEEPGLAHADVPPRLLKQLEAHGWPGNVRELRNVAQRLLVAPEHSPFPAERRPRRPRPTLDSCAGAAFPARGASQCVGSVRARLPQSRSAAESGQRQRRSRDRRGLARHDLQTPAQVQPAAHEQEWRAGVFLRALSTGLDCAWLWRCASAAASMRVAAAARRGLLPDRYGWFVRCCPARGSRPLAAAACPRGWPPAPPCVRAPGCVRRSSDEPGRALRAGRW
jgi:DNA-binding NtrC family response regulator